MLAAWSQPKTASPTLIVIGVLLSVVMGWLLGTHTLLAAAAFAALLVGLVVIVKPESAFVVSILSIVLGQLVRIPVGGGEASIIPNDVILPVLIIAWTWRRLSSGTWRLPRHSLTLPIIFVVLSMGLSLLMNRSDYSQHELISGSLYFLRWLEYLALFWLSFDFLRTHQRAQFYLKLLIWTGAGLALLGFVQLKLFPDFSFMVPKGWDPHIGRLLSTWFDPNFLAGYFTLLTSISLAVALSQPWRQARWWWVATGIMSVATVLTFSRSGYVGFVVAIGLVALIRSRALLYLGGIAFIATILFVPRVQERVIGIRTIDETAKLRLVSYNNAATVIADHPWFGVGYNLYKYVQVRYGFLKDTQEHSASGSDSSLLTIWVTTGVIGLIAYLWLLIAMLREAWQTWRNRHLPALWQAFGLGLFSGLLGLFAHSQFVNGLQYPHIMEVMWIFVAMAIMVRQPEPA